VPHPRWSQAEETPLGSPMKVPTVLYNGYPEFVADLYQGLENEPLFM
jgi:methionine sulfoxide reductase catalytic subunit